MSKTYYTAPDWRADWPHFIDAAGRRCHPAVIPADDADALRTPWRLLIAERRTMTAADLAPLLDVAEDAVRAVLYELMWLTNAPIIYERTTGTWQLARGYLAAMEAAEREWRRADSTDEPIAMLRAIVAGGAAPCVPAHRAALVEHAEGILREHTREAPITTKALAERLKDDDYTLANLSVRGSADKHMTPDAVRGTLLRAMREYGYAVCTTSDGAWIPAPEVLGSDVEHCIKTNLRARPEAMREHARIIESAAAYTYPQTQEQADAIGMLARGHSDRWQRDHHRGHAKQERAGLLDLAHRHVTRHAGAYHNFNAELTAGLVPAWTAQQRDDYYDTAAAKQLIRKGRVAPKLAERLREGSPFKPSTVTRRAPRRGETADLAKRETSVVCPFDENGRPV